MTNDGKAQSLTDSIIEKVRDDLHELYDEVYYQQHVSAKEYRPRFDEMLRMIVECDSYLGMLRRFRYEILEAFHSGKSHANKSSMEDIYGNMEGQDERDSD